MPGFIWGYGEKGPTSGLKPPGMKEAQYGTGTGVMLKLRLTFHVAPGRTMLRLGEGRVISIPGV